MRHAISLQPNGAVTGIGSLPLKNPEAAVNFVAKMCPEIPFWPQLPRRSKREPMVEQALGPLTDWLQKRRDSYGYVIKPPRLDAFQTHLHQGGAYLDVTRAAGFFAFEHALQAGQFGQAIALKGQLVGPITLGGQLFAGDEPFIHQPELMAGVGRYIARIACWQIKRMQQWHLPVIIMIDEPGLTMANPEGDNPLAGTLARVLKEVLAEIANAGGIAGVRCWGTFPPATIPLLNPAIISFDAYHELEAFIAHPDAIAFVKHGGLVAFGLVPLWPELVTVTAKNLYRRWQKAVLPALPPPQMARRSIITTSHGLGLLDRTAAEASFNVVRQLAGLVNRHAAAATTAHPQPAQ